MFTYSDESKGADPTADEGAGASGSSRSPISITFNEFMKLARLAKVVS